MPALLSESEGQVLMAANITRGHPWHRMGKQVEGDMSISEALKLSGSDDLVLPTVLHTINEDAEFVILEDGERAIRIRDLEEVQQYQAAKSNKYGTLGVHSPGFNIKQRREILEMAYDFTGLDRVEGAHVDTIGNLGDPPAQFFAYIRVPDLVIDPSGIADTIERGLYVATSFDGTLANTIGYSNIRVVCSNTLQMAMRSSSQTIRAKHTANADERMEQMAVALDYIGAVEKATVQNAERMLQVEDGDKALANILDHFYPVNDIKLSDIAKTRRNRERGDIRLMFHGQGNTNVDLVGNNGWAAYNAFTEYIDHASGVKVGKETSKAGIQRATRAVMPNKFVDMKITASKIVLDMVPA